MVESIKIFGIYYLTEPNKKTEKLGINNLKKQKNVKDNSGNGAEKHG